MPFNFATIEIYRAYLMMRQPISSTLLLLAALLSLGVVHAIDNPLFKANNNKPKENNLVFPPVLPKNGNHHNNNNHRNNNHNHHGLAIAGKVSSVLQKLRHAPAQLAHIRIGLAHAFQAADVVWITAAAFLTQPLARQWYVWLHPDRKSTPYEHSWLNKAATVIGEIGKVAVVVYTLDMASIVARKLGFVVPPAVNDKLAQFCYTVWGAHRLRRIKAWWLRRALRKHPDEASTAHLLDHVTDGVLAVFLLLFVQDIFQITMGKGLSSIFALGGLGGLVFSLASKDLAQMVLSGLAVRNTDKFTVGEYVQFGDGTAGTVDKLGVFELYLRGSDGIVTRVPNGEITSQRLQNLSRANECMVKQNLMFKYDDINKIPAVLETIKDEIKKSCPKLITDGSRAFRAVWTEFKDDHLEAFVQASFDLPPLGDAYHENKQNMLLAIARAVEKHGVQFALPTSVCLNEDVKTR